MTLPGVVAIDRRQRRWPGLAIPIAVLKKFSDDQAGSLAAQIAYYAFMSLFPLLLLLFSVLGFALGGDPGAEHRIENSVVGQFPVLRTSLQTHQLRGSVAAVVIGALGLMWGGLAATGAVQQAFNRIWAVPMKDRPDFFMTRLRGVATVLALALLSIAASLASGLVSGGLGGTPLRIAGIALSLGLNVCLFVVAFKLLSSVRCARRSLLIAAGAAAVLWELLQVGGTVYVDHVVRHASEAFGVFALVLGLLAWLHAMALAMLYASELGVVLERRLWPRSLVDPHLPGDRETLRRLAKVEERLREEHIEVSFEE